MLRSTAPAATTSSEASATDNAVILRGLNTPLNAATALEARTFWQARFQHALNRTWVGLPSRWKAGQVVLGIKNPLDARPLVAMVDGEFQLQTDQMYNLRRLPRICRDVALTSDKQVGKGGAFAEGVALHLGAPVAAAAATTGAILVAEVAVVGVLGAATFGAALVLLPLSLIIGVVASRLGSQYAQAYKTVLQKTYDLLLKGEFAQAKKELEDMLRGGSNVQSVWRNRIVRALRRGFLKHIHYALGHYFNGVIIENELSSEDRHDRALAAYALACEEAYHTGSDEITLMIQTRRLYLFRQKIRDCIASGRSSAEIAAVQANLAMDFRLLENYSGNCLREIVCLITERMTSLTCAFSQSALLSDSQLAEVNHLLQLEILFVFENVQGDYGSFLSIAATFFRGAALSYFYHVDQRDGCLEEATYAALVKRDSDESVASAAEVEPRQAKFNLEDRLRFAAEQFQKLFSLIRHFRTKYPTKSVQSDIQNALTFMEDFAVHFVVAHSEMGLGEESAVRAALQYIEEDQRLNQQRIANTREGTVVLTQLQGLLRSYGVPFPSYEDWLDALLQPAHRVIDNMIDQTGEAFAKEFVHFPAYALSAHGHTHESIRKAFKERVLCRDLNRQCGEEVPTLQTWLDAVKDPHSPLIDRVLGHGHCETVLSDLKKIGTLFAIPEKHIQEISQSLKERNWLAHFNNELGLHYDSVAACLVALQDVNHAEIAPALAGEQRARLLSDLEALKAIAKNQVQAIDVAKAVLTRRALLIDLNTKLGASFPHLEAWESALLTPDHAEINRILIVKGHIASLTEMFERFQTVGVNAQTYACLEKVFSFTAAFAQLFIYLNEHYQIQFVSANDFLNAVFNEEDTRITSLLQRGQGDLITKLKTVPEAASFDGAIHARKDRAITYLEGRLFLVKALNEKFEMTLPSLAAWIVALESENHADMARIAKVRGSELFEALMSCPAHLPEAVALKRAAHVFSEQYFLSQLKLRFELTFSDFNQCTQALMGEIPHAGLTAFIKKALQGDDLIALINRFPPTHSAKAQLQPAVRVLSLRLLVAKFNKTLQSDFQDLDSCLGVIETGQEVAMLRKLDTHYTKVADWLSKLPKEFVSAKRVDDLHNKLKHHRYLFRLNTELKAAMSETHPGETAAEVVFTDVVSLLEQVYAMQGPVADVVSRGAGRKLHKMLPGLIELGLSVERVTTARDKLMSAVLLHELRHDFSWEVSSLDHCLACLLTEPEFVKNHIFSPGKGDKFLSWLKGLPSKQINVRRREEICAVFESAFFLYQFNQRFELNFSSLEDCFDALMDASNERVKAIMQREGRTLITMLETLPAPSPDAVTVKEALIQDLKQRLLLAELREDFGLSTEGNIDNILLRLTRRLTSLQAEDGVKLVSERTGRTLLHCLAEFEDGFALRENVRRLARRLLALRYHRDNQHITPEVMLRRRDPFQLSNTFPSVQSETNAVQLRQLDEFLERVKRDAALRLAAADQREQFILLEGDSGTGKTTTVTAYLANRPDCEITQWESGNKDDKWVGQIEERAGDFFKQAIVRANEERRRDKLQILFIDEISSVCPALRGEASAGHHNPAAVVDVFQIGVTSIKGSRVVLIGATNYPNKISRAMLDRAQGGRISFRLPDLAGREKILMFLFRKHVLPSASIKRLAEITTGWSPRELGGIVKGMPCDGTLLDEGKLNAAFHEASRANEKAFSLVHSMVDLSLPVFKTKIEGDPLGELARIHPHLARRFDDIRSYLRQPGSYLNTRFHLLLFGPAGSGKTYAIKQLLRCTNLPYFVVRGAISAEELEQVFAYAAQFKPALFFVDEIDAICCIPGVQECLQTNMDGMVQSQVVVLGATNKKTELPAPIRSRFMEEEVPPLSPLQKQILLSKVVTEYLQPPFCLNAAPCLAQALAEGGAALAAAAGNLSVREVVRGLTCGLGRYDAEAKEAAQSQGGVPKVTLTLQQVLDCMTPEAQASVLQQPAPAPAPIPLLIPQRNAAQLIQAVGFHRQGRPAEVSAAQISASSAAPAASSR